MRARMASVSCSLPVHQSQTITLTASSLATNLTLPAVSMDRLRECFDEPRLSMEALDLLLCRSSWLPLLARLARLGTLPRLTGGRPVVCMIVSRAYE